MKKFSKVIAMSLCIAMMLSVAACGAAPAPSSSSAPAASSASASSEAAPAASSEAPAPAAPVAPIDSITAPVSLVHWQHTSAARNAIVTELAEGLMKKNKNITITTEYMPMGDYNTKLLPAMAAGTGPDTMQIEAGQFERFVKNGNLQPIDERVIPVGEFESAFIPETLSALKRDGKYYGIPTDVQTIVLYWNKALFKDAGLDPEKAPNTWEELQEYAKKLTKYGADGKIVQSGLGMGGYSPVVESFMLQCGAKLVDDKGKFTVNTPEVLEAYTFASELVTKDKVYHPEFMSRWTAFRTGKGAMVFGHPAMLGNFIETAPDIDFGVALVPEHKGNRNVAVTSWAFGIDKKADPLAASVWLDALTNEEAQTQWAVKTGEIPSRKALHDSAEINKDPRVKIGIDSIKSASYGKFQVSAYGSVWKKCWERLVLNNEAPAAVLADAEKQLNAERAKLMAD
ncbi:MAG: ABC transporter substrate-binding protein [Angelakisella sp.]